MKIKLAFFIWENWHFCWEQVAIFVLVAQIKIASFIIIVTDQTCQFYPECCSLKKSLIILVPDNKCQFYLHCRESKLLSFILIVTYQNFSTATIRKKMAIFIFDNEDKTINLDL